MSNPQDIDSVQVAGSSPAARHLTRAPAGASPMSILDDLRLAVRSLRAWPGFLSVALATLGMAIGANIAVFTLVNAVLLRPLPFGDRSDRVVTVARDPQLAGRGLGGRTALVPRPSGPPRVGRARGCGRLRSAQRDHDRARVQPSELVRCTRSAAGELHHVLRPQLRVALRRDGARGSDRGRGEHQPDGSLPRWMGAHRIDRAVGRCGDEVAGRFWPWPPSDVSPIPASSSPPTAAPGCWTPPPWPS